MFPGFIYHKMCIKMSTSHVNVVLFPYFFFLISLAHSMVYHLLSCVNFLFNSLFCVYVQKLLILFVIFFIVQKCVYIKICYGQSGITTLSINLSWRGITLMSYSMFEMYTCTIFNIISVLCWRIFIKHFFNSFD